METKKCPLCGEEILTVAKKCKYCGEWLKEEETPKQQIACPVCSELIDKQTVICPHCSENIQNWDKKTKVQIPVQEKLPDKPRKVIDAVPEKGDVVYEEEKRAPRIFRMPDKKDGSTQFFNYYFGDIFGGQYADFKGKMSRKRYWIFAITTTILSLFFMGVVNLDSTNVAMVLFGYSFFGLIMLLPSLSAAVRRLHDTGKSGWWLFIGLIPLVGAIWLLVLLCKKGELTSKQVATSVVDKIAIVAGIVISLGFYIYGMKGAENNYLDYLTENATVATADIKNLSFASGKCYGWAPADFDICDTEIETDCGIGNIYIDKNGVVILSEDCVDNPTTYYIGTYSAQSGEYLFRFTQYCDSYEKTIATLDKDWLVTLEPLNCIDWAYKWENDDNRIFVCKPLEATYFIDEIKRVFK